MKKETFAEYLMGVQDYMLLEMQKAYRQAPKWYHTAALIKEDKRRGKLVDKEILRRTKSTTP